MHETDTVIKVGDSKPGWAKSLRELIALLYAGQIPTWDMSQVRAAGERLKTMGGRALGHNLSMTCSASLWRLSRKHRDADCHRVSRPDV